MTERTVIRGDVATFEFAWLEALVDEWAPEYLYQAGQVIRPSRANGYLLVCTRAGLSGFREPAWPREENAQVDGELGGVAVGTAEWSVKRPENASIPAIASIDFAVLPAGLTEVSRQTIQAARTSRITLDGTTSLAGEYMITASIVDGLARDHFKRASFILTD